MAYGLSNGHVTHDVTWPWKVKLVTPICLERNISKTTWARDFKFGRWLCTGMPSRRTNNLPESGRGLGHVTPTIFGSTVGYLASAWLLVLVYLTASTELLKAYRNVLLGLCQELSAGFIRHNVSLSSTYSRGGRCCVSSKNSDSLSFCPIPEQSGVVDPGVKVNGQNYQDIAFYERSSARY